MYTCFGSGKSSFQYPWIPLCGDQWSNEEATMVCRQQGLDVEGGMVHVTSIIIKLFFLVAGSTMLSDPTYISYQCDGSEFEITDCSYTCASTCSAATVMCSTELACNTSGCVRIK